MKKFSNSALGFQKIGADGRFATLNPNFQANTQGSLNLSAIVFVGYVVGYLVAASNFINCFRGKWRTEEDSNPRPLDS